MTKENLNKVIPPSIPGRARFDYRIWMRNEDLDKINNFRDLSYLKIELAPMPMPSGSISVRELVLSYDSIAFNSDYLPDFIRIVSEKLKLPEGAFVVSADDVGTLVCADFTVKVKKYEVILSVNETDDEKFARQRWEQSTFTP